MSAVAAPAVCLPSLRLLRTESSLPRQLRVLGFRKPRFLHDYNAQIFWLNKGNFQPSKGDSVMV